MRFRRIALALSLLASTAAGTLACGSDNKTRFVDASVSPPADAAPPDAPSIDAAIADCNVASGTALTTELVAGGFRVPILVTHAPGDPRLFVVQNDGRIFIIEDGQRLETPFLDLSTSGEDLILSGGERGLLGLTFHPDYATNRRFFIYYSSRLDPGPDDDHIAIIAEYKVSEADPNVAETAEKVILSQIQPRANHNGGNIEFGPDGMLYIGLGDGGNFNNGQTLSNRLGAMLRIDVSEEFGDQSPPYGIPADNPFAGGGGAPEAWAVGLRNPWRWSFDPANGDLWIADVGQACIEEINRQPAGVGGLNYGWRIMEGTQCRPGTIECIFGDGCDRTGLTLPVFEYEHFEVAASVTGGHVYRGGCIPDIDGWYIFGDYVQGEIWAIDTAESEPTRITLPFAGAGRVTSFGKDVYGELYIVGLEGADGRVSRIIAAPTK